jgi:cellulose synthase/poly-beta-1,6-N-acetylglucosamine synthase-like glycosyltransferase
LFSIFGLYKIVLLVNYIRYKETVPEPEELFSELPPVTIQLPIYNEMYVVERLVKAACAIDYPSHLLEVQVLDDSTDETCALAEQVTAQMQALGKDVAYVHRTDRKDYKAGALAEGLKVAKGKFVAIFDADFLPSTDFLHKTIHFFTNPKIGMVQARWGFLNEGLSFLTRIQSVFLNGHFIIEHTSRHRAGRFFNFNGTAGIWRKEAIYSAGGWQGDTLTEDLDLSYRAQLKGWKFVYLKDLIIPSELPLEIGGFKSQQFRWVKGMTQVGIKLLPEIWKSPISLLKKLDATFHLLSNTGYITTTLMALLVVPTLYMFDQFFRHWEFLAI